MKAEEREVLSKIRLETAQDCLDTAKAMLSLEKQRSCKPVLLCCFSFHASSSGLRRNRYEPSYRK